MAKELDGKIAAVTGAASGIGLASSEAMLAAGARVVMIDRDQAALTALRDKHGDAVIPVVIDLLDPKDCAGLKPSSEGKRVAFDGAGRTVKNGPFAQASELVAGYWLWNVKDMDEAVAWVKRCPNPMLGPSEIEIRPLYEMADLL